MNITVHISYNVNITDNEVVSDEFHFFLTYFYLISKNN